MKKKSLKLFCLLFFSIVFINVSKSQVTLDWVKSIGVANGVDVGSSITTDVYGNVYTIGYFSGKVDFDPGIGVYNLTSYGHDIYIVKVDAIGNFKWAKNFGSSIYDDSGSSIAIDKNGYVYTTGYYYGTVDFDPDSNNFYLTSNGSYDSFILKLDSDGNFVWAKSIGGIAFDMSFDIAIDSNSNVYTTGYFEQSSDFDPDTSKFILTPDGPINSFILKLDSSGKFVWANKFGGKSNCQSHSISIDKAENIYVAGYFSDTADFKVGSKIVKFYASGIFDSFILKSDRDGNFIWVKEIGGDGDDRINGMTSDINNNIYLTGSFQNTVDFDPSIKDFNITASAFDAFVLKLDSSGHFIWVRNMGGKSLTYAYAISIDLLGNLYVIGSFYDTTDFDSGSSVFNLIPSSNSDVFVSKLDSSGVFVWAVKLGGTGYDQGLDLSIDSKMNIIVTGGFQRKADFDPTNEIFYMYSDIVDDVFICKLRQKGIFGRVYNDISKDCVFNIDEIGLPNWKVLINPGNIIAETNELGMWYLDSLPSGNYTLYADTTGKWKRSCPSLQNFTVNSSNYLTKAPSFGFISTEPCAKPDISVTVPFLRRCFPNQKVYIQASNHSNATDKLSNAYVELELDSFVTLDSTSISYSKIDNNLYRFDVGTINPGMNVKFCVPVTIGCETVLGQTKCFKATIYPIADCFFDTISDTEIHENLPECKSHWDKSDLEVKCYSKKDSIHFKVKNKSKHGEGDMSCYSHVRIYIDGKVIKHDSVKLNGEDEAEYKFADDGRTWRCEADQHPHHRGKSHPNATIEGHGNKKNWTPNLVNILPHDDADPIVDIYCGLITGSFDPNDKTGYPLGLGEKHIISPNQNIEYIIRFQNTGNDTAFKVVIRDTLDSNFDIFSVVSGSASHNYKFKTYGPRVLEWTFDKIMLPDSFINEPESNGFVKFTVSQNKDLPDNTIILNTANIYFDYNEPIKTNTTIHTIDRGIKSIKWINQITIQDSACELYSYNGLEYTKSGNYYQEIGNNLEDDTLVILNLKIKNNSFATKMINSCNSYLAPDGKTYNSSGKIKYTVPNASGCDSIISIDFNVYNIDTSLNVNSDTIISNSDYSNYQWFDCANSIIIPNETNQNFIPKVDGKYAVIISKSVCIALSSCYDFYKIGLLQNEFKQLSIYPNPINQYFNIDFGDKLFDGEIIIRDITGRELRHEEIINKSLYTLKFDAPKGIYLITISNKKQTETFKLIKE